MGLPVEVRLNESEAGGVKEPPGMPGDDPPRGFFLKRLKKPPLRSVLTVFSRRSVSSNN